MGWHPDHASVSWAKWPQRYHLEQPLGEWELSTDWDKTVDNLKLDGKKPDP